MTCPDWFCDEVANNLWLWGEGQDKMSALGIFQYVDTLMYQPGRWRKEWSHNGALFSLPGEPRHWHDPNIPGESYWDPCNRIYARTMEGAFLYAPKDNWSGAQSFCEVQWGDICEIMLAMQWVDRLSRVVGRVDCIRVVQHPLVLGGARQAPAVEEMVRITYKLSTMLDAFIYCGFREWAVVVDEMRIMTGPEMWKHYARLNPVTTYF